MHVSVLHTCLLFFRLLISACSPAASVRCVSGTRLRPFRPSRPQPSPSSPVQSSPLQPSLASMSLYSKEGVGDLVLLETVDEANILSTLKKRYQKDLIYTHIGQTHRTNRQAVDGSLAQASVDLRGTRPCRARG